MAKQDRVYLSHILNSIEQIEKYTFSIGEEEFLKNQLLIDAVIRNFEIIGEATKRVSATTRDRYSNIEWRKMAGMRDKLIHDYLSVDY